MECEAAAGGVPARLGVRHRLVDHHRISAVLLVMAREMTIEAIAAQQHLAAAECDAAEQGAEQWAMSIVDQEMRTPGYETKSSMKPPLGIAMCGSSARTWMMKPSLITA